MKLAALVEEAVSRCGGRNRSNGSATASSCTSVEPANAVVRSLELSERVPATGLPPTHVGINAGGVVYENGDFYGRTVNVAARIAAHAAAGRVLVSDAVHARCDLPDVRFERLGPVAFKGVANDVVVFEACRA